MFHTCLNALCSLGMTNAVKSESGIDLLQRLAVRPKLLGLQPQIFGENGPQPGDVIEINEKNGCVKTILLTQWVIQCILPASWKGIPVGGLQVGVVFLSSDHLFSPLFLAAQLEKKLKRTIRQQRKLESGTGTALVKEITKDSLKRLSIYEHHSKIQMLFNFCSVKTFILSHPITSVIIIDSLSAYYWEDRLNGSIQSMEKYCQNLLYTLIEKLKKTNITVFYTIQQFLRDTPERDNETSGAFVYSLTLENRPEHIVTVEDKRHNIQSVKKYQISKGEFIIQ